MAEYNGWTNWETWNTNLWCQEYGLEEELLAKAEELSEATPHDEIVTTLADWLESRIYEMMGEEIPASGLFRDMIVTSLQAVNWREIVGVAASDFVDR